MTDKKMFSATGNQMVADAFRQVNPDVILFLPRPPLLKDMQNSLQMAR